MSLYCDSATLDVPGMQLGFIELSKFRCWDSIRGPFGVKSDYFPILGTLPLFAAIQKRIDEHNSMASGRIEKVNSQSRSCHGSGLEFYEMSKFFFWVLINRSQNRKKSS